MMTLPFSSAVRVMGASFVPSPVKTISKSFQTPFAKPDYIARLGLPHGIPKLLLVMNDNACQNGRRCHYRNQNQECASDRGCILIQRIWFMLSQCHQSHVAVIPSSYLVPLLFHRVGASCRRPRLAHWASSVRFCAVKRIFHTLLKR